MFQYAEVINKMDIIHELCMRLENHPYILIFLIIITIIFCSLSFIVVVKNGGILKIGPFELKLNKDKIKFFKLDPSNPFPTKEGNKPEDQKPGEKEIKKDGEIKNLEFSIENGIIPKEYFDTQTKRINGEVFAVEMLKKPIIIERDKYNRILLTVDRNGVTQVIITNEAKRQLCNKHILKQGKKFVNTIIEMDSEIQDLLTGRLRSDGNLYRFNKFPLRWASGGILSVVNWCGRKWIPFFFRDIRPYGWNISLGSTERDFDDDGNIPVKSRSRIDEELNDPWNFIAREFEEESFILSGNPETQRHNLFFKKFTFGIADREEPSERAKRFMINNINLRFKEDSLSIDSRNDENSVIHIDEDKIGKTNMSIRVISKGKRPDMNNVLFCFSLLDLGIEIAKSVEYDLGDNEYMLDGEIIHNIDGTKELARMPVALISYAFLEKIFGSENYTQHYTKGIQPSIEIKEAIDPKDIHIFKWDVDQRVRILEGELILHGSQRKRFTDWYDKFGGNFLNSEGKPSNQNPSRLFVPGTAKILNIFFNVMNRSG